MSPKSAAELLKARPARVLLLLHMHMPPRAQLALSLAQDGWTMLDVRPDGEFSRVSLALTYVSVAALQPKTGRTLCRGGCRAHSMSPCT